MNVVAEAQYEPLAGEVMPPPLDINPVVTLPEEPAYDDDLRRVVAARRHPDNLESLIKDSRSLMESVIGKYFIHGGDRNDLLQEATIGFCKSVGAYDGIRSSFSSFAITCMDRQVQKAVFKASRPMQGPLNDYISLSPSSDSHENHIDLDEQLEDSLADPVETLHQRQLLQGVLGMVADKLTPTETTCFLIYRLTSATPEQIAETLDIEAKEVNNALRRARRKMPDFDDVTAALM